MKKKTQQSLKILCRWKKITIKTVKMELMHKIRNSTVQKCEQKRKYEHCKPLFAYHIWPLYPLVFYCSVHFTAAYCWVFCRPSGLSEHLNFVALSLFSLSLNQNGNNIQRNKHTNKKPNINEMNEWSWFKIFNINHTIVFFSRK